jgi:pSer/pThr/pTyr-binding forkhead associated (FHA) protein
MKVSLVVQTAGKSAGQTIPINLAQFVIGRDPQCNLRPASAVISKRHCALIIRTGKVYVRDFDSTNGTFINEDQVKGEREILNGDTLKIGPLGFKLVIETTTPVNKPTPVPPKAGGGGGSDDESVAAMLLSLQEEGVTADSPGSADSGEIPGGSTVMDMMPVGDAVAAAKEEAKKAEEERKPEDKKAEEKKAEEKKKQEKSVANTSMAAKAILEKYTRRQRS